MTKHITFIFSLITIGLLALITFASGSNVSELSLIFRPLYDVTFYSPFDNKGFHINHTHLEMGGHFFIFFAVGLVIRQWLVKQTPWICLVILAIIAGSSELGQSLAMDRTTSWDDFSINIIAGSIGILMSNIFVPEKRMTQFS